MEDVTGGSRASRGRLLLVGLIGVVVVATLAFLFLVRSTENANRPTFVYFRLKT